MKPLTKDDLENMASTMEQDAPAHADKLRSWFPEILKNQELVLDFNKKIADGWKFYDYKTWLKLEQDAEKCEKEEHDKLIADYREVYLKALNDVEIVERLKKTIESCKDYRHRTKNRYVQYEDELVDKLQEELQKILGIYDEKTMGSLPYPDIAKGEEK